MTRLRISLFGRMQVELEGRPLAKGLDARKVQELLGYLLLYRNRLHPRETLADVLWGENSNAQARKCLRQALWQLQTALKAEGGSNDGMLLIEQDWVGINLEADFWTDVREFEDAHNSAQGVPGHALAPDAANALARAVELHRSGLLQDWCIFERERFENMYLVMLSKLMAYCEARQQYEIGLVYGHRILQFDRAHERTHRRMMRLHYMAGDRTAALRQYDRCVAALEEELGVKPARWTVALYEHVRADQMADLMPVPQPVPAASAETQTDPDIPLHLSRLQALLYECRHELQHYIQAAGLPTGD